MSHLLHFSLPQIAFIVASIFWSDGSYQESTYSRSRQSSLKRTRPWQILRVTMRVELGGVLRRKASDQTDLSTMKLMHVGVAACRRSLRHNQWCQRGLRTLRRLRRCMYSGSAVSTKASTVVCSSSASASWSKASVMWRWVTMTYLNQLLASSILMDFPLCDENWNAIASSILKTIATGDRWKMKLENKA